MLSKADVTRIAADVAPEALNAAGELAAYPVFRDDGVIEWRDPFVAGEPVVAETPCALMAGVMYSLPEREDLFPTLP